MPKQVRETAAITEAAAAEAKKSGRMEVQFISPGWGSSGYYSAEVLEAAAADKVIPAGTHMYADHPTDTEFYERPERSIKDLMAVTTEDARLGSDGALVGEVQVVPAWRELVETVRDAIGVSIRGSATDIVEGEAEGRRGGIIEGLVAPVASVDFVTRAGRGGKVLAVLESARANQRALGHGIDESTVNDTREELQSVLRDAYGGDQRWIYVRDFDDTTVWFDVGDDGIWGQTYSTSDGGAVELTGERTEVRVSTTYVPATRSDSTTTTTKESQEDDMGKIQIEESEHSELTEKAGRVDALEAERDTEKARADAAEKKLAEATAAAEEKGPRTPRQVMEDRDKDLRRQVAELHAREGARSIVDEELAEAWLPPSTVARLKTELMESLPLVDDKLDEQALRTRCVERRDQHELEAAEALEAAGVGTPRGLGAMSTPAAGGDAAKYTDSLAESFQSLGLSESEATTAVKGR